MGDQERGLLAILGAIIAVAAIFQLFPIILSWTGVMQWLLPVADPARSDAYWKELASPIAIVNQTARGGDLVLAAKNHGSDLVFLTHVQFQGWNGDGKLPSRVQLLPDAQKEVRLPLPAQACGDNGAAALTLTLVYESSNGLERTEKGSEPFILRCG